jgi:predicted permease
VLTLALGIGGNTAMFTVIRAVLLKPLAYPDPDRLVLVKVASPVRYEMVKSAARSLTELGAFGIMPENMSLSGADPPEALKGARVSANFLGILGVAPLLGRRFLTEEDTPGGPPVAMISAALWRRRFGGEPSLAGKTATINSTPYTIIGVLPDGFQFPFEGLDVWVTRPSELSVIPPKSRRISSILTGFARLKPGVSLEQASAELKVLNEQYARAHPEMLDSKPRAAMKAELLKDQLVANVRALLWMLFGAVGFVLLIACANVAGLLLARATSRSREFAVRAAIGAGRGRLIRQLLAESVVLALLGGAFGVLLAKWSLSGITGMTAFNLPRIGEIRLDATVLGFAVALSIATGVLFGLVPSLGASRPNLVNVLRASGEAQGQRVARQRVLGVSARGLLVIGQVALSIVLLIGAALLMESLGRLHAVNPGFQPANLLTMQLALPPTRYDSLQKRAAFYQNLVQRVEAHPGVHSATIAMTLPMLPWPGSPVAVTEMPPVKFTERPIGKVQSVTPAYFRTLQIPLRKGREFTDQDNLTTPGVVIINESLARHFWPAWPRGQNPIGQLITIGVGPQPIEIVGIVADVNEFNVDPRLEVFIPCAQTGPQSAALVVRTEGDPMAFANSVRGQSLAIDRDLPVTAVRAMDDVVEASLGQRRLTMKLLEAFAAVALLLAIVGLYGVIAYSVAQRTREVGIRRALGAQQSDILRLVVGQGLSLTLVGLMIGIGGALALTRLLTSLLFHVTATDPVTYVAAALLFLIVALAASYIPARRAARIDPLEALR